MPQQLYCQWCGKELTEGDRLRFEFSQNDFDNGDNWRSVFEPGPSTGGPFLTCDLCRQGMVANREDLRVEEDAVKSSRYLWVTAVCLLALYIAYEIIRTFIF
jgi:hypothetical protein